MHMERLEIELPDVFFEVKDDFLYYLDSEPRRVVQINLKSGERSEFEFESFPECHRKGIKLLNGEIYLSHRFVDESKQRLSKLTFNTERLSSGGEGGIVEAISDVEIEGEFKNWNESHYRSRYLSTNPSYSQFLCLESNKLYDIPWLSWRNPVFTHNSRFYYVTSETNALFLNSFPLDDQNQTTRTRLTGAVQLFTNGVVSCVFGDDVYFVEYGACPKIFKLNLSFNTVENITEKINGFDKIANIRMVNHDNETKYFTDFDRISKQFKGFYKINVSEAKTNPLKCPRCEAVFYNPKIVKGCGHSICESCEKDMLKQFMDTDNRKVNCPVADCSNVAVLNKGEELPTNRALKDIINNPQFMCKSCKERLGHKNTMSQTSSTLDDCFNGDIVNNQIDENIHNLIKIAIVDETKNEPLDRVQTID